MKKRVLALSIRAMFRKSDRPTHQHCCPVDYLQPGTPIKVRFRGQGSSSDTLDFRVFLSHGNFPNGK